MNMVFQVSGMTCEGCVATLSAALRSVAGVAESDVRLAEGTARVRFDEPTCDAAKVVAAIRGAGFEVTGFSPGE